MAIRPTQHWRQYAAQEAEQIASGHLDPECAGLADLFPEPMPADTDAVLASFEAESAALNDPSDQQVFDVVERVVVALNAMNDRHGGGAYETDEREDLCAYIDALLAEAGIDVQALAARRGIGRHEITDEWRRW